MPGRIPSPCMKCRLTPATPRRCQFLPASSSSMMKTPGSPRYLSSILDRVSLGRAPARMASAVCLHRKTGLQRRDCSSSAIRIPNCSARSRPRLVRGASAGTSPPWLGSSRSACLSSTVTARSLGSDARHAQRPEHSCTITGAWQSGPTATPAGCGPLPDGSRPDSARPDTLQRSFPCRQ